MWEVPRSEGYPVGSLVLPLLGRAWRSARRHRQSQAQRTPLASRRGRTGVSLHERQSTSEGLLEVGQKGGFRAMKLKRVRDRRRAVVANSGTLEEGASGESRLQLQADVDYRRELAEVLGKVLSPRRHRDRGWRASPVLKQKSIAALRAASSATSRTSTPTSCYIDLGSIELRRRGRRRHWSPIDRIAGIEVGLGRRRVELTPHTSHLTPRTSHLNTYSFHRRCIQNHCSGWRRIMRSRASL